MKLRLVALLTVIAAAVFVGVLGLGGAKSDTGDPVTYTFAQAVSAGIISPASYGCTSGTACTPAGGGSFCNFSDPTLDAAGYVNPDDLATAMNNSDTGLPTGGAGCVEDPRTTEFVTSTDASSDQSGSSRAHSQQVGNGDLNGWRVGIEGGSPASPGNHNGDEIFARLHVIGDNLANRDDEIGWYWCPCYRSGTVTVYTQTGTPGSRNPLQGHPSWHIYQGYYYGFRFRGWGQAGAVAELLDTKGHWDPILYDSSLPCATSQCYGVIGTELKCVDGSNCPNQNSPTDGTGTNYHVIQYRSQGSWYPWALPPLTTWLQVLSPLYFCGESAQGSGNDNNPPHGNYTWFRTPKANGC
jgi:hypothetical protein